MADSGSPPSEDPGHTGRRLALVACCLVAVVASGALVAGVGSSGLAGSPIDSVLPGEDVSNETAADGDIDGQFGGVDGDDTGLGSLTPAGQTGVGGGLGLDNDTFATLDTEVHFVAESSQPTYWRTATFDTYTGSGWERNTDTDPYDAPLHDEGFEQIEYNVTLRQSATALPTPWQPTAVDGVDESNLGVAPDGSIHATEELPEGTTFTGVSHAPQDSPGTLREADDSHPDELDRYTQLPDDTAPRLEIQTSNIVADADSRYDVAIAIQNYLRDNKGYSLDAYRESDSIAETFFFEMEAGYCEYFATTMGAMLRTQDIPTRYAVGYSSGQPAGDDTYEVRGMNAHAWVEVYFEGIGWVQFDPTPPADRLDAQAGALDDIGEEYNVTEPASPGETFDPDDFGNDTDDDGGLSVELNRTAVPGEAVEVTVTDNPAPAIEDREPLSGLEVFFNDRSIGVTDENGTVTGTVPDADTFEIAVFPPEAAEPSDDVGPSLATGSPAPMGSTVAGGSGGPVVGLAGGASVTADDTPARSDPQRPDRDEPILNETVDVETEATLDISGEVVPGNEIGVTALVGDDPLADAAVFVDGQRHGETDGGGWTTVELPSSPGPVTVAVEREPVAGETTLELPTFDIEAETEWPLALPFAPTTVEATYGDEPAAGVPVEVGGEQVAATGTDGEATLRLPVTGTAEIAAVGNGIRAETTVDGLLVNLLLVLGVVGAIAVGALSLRSRLSIGARIDIAAAAGTVRTALASPDTLPARLLVGLAGRVERLVATARAILRDLLGLVLGALGRAPSRFDDGAAGGSDGPVVVDATGEPVTADQATVRAAWGEFLDHVSAPAATHTPGELATHAIERDGLPAEPVRTLRDAFRAVEYGSRPADGDRVQSAVAAIERAAGGSDRRTDGGTVAGDDERTDGGSVSDAKTDNCRDASAGGGSR